MASPRSHIIPLPVCHGVTYTSRWACHTSCESSKLRINRLKSEGETGKATLKERERYQAETQHKLKANLTDTALVVVITAGLNNNMSVNIAHRV